jgi:hypothetical protein
MGCSRKTLESSKNRRASGKLQRLAALDDLVWPDARGAMAEGADGGCGLGRRAEGKVVRPRSAQGGAGAGPRLGLRGSRMVARGGGHGRALVRLCGGRQKGIRKGDEKGDTLYGVLYLGHGSFPPHNQQTAEHTAVRHVLSKDRVLTYTPGHQASFDSKYVRVQFGCHIFLATTLK